MANQDDIDAAARDTRAALLKQIKESAESSKVASHLERLAYAYALTVGAAYGKPPGGLAHLDISK
jgi:hypothetical protein